MHRLTDWAKVRQAMPEPDGSHPTHGNQVYQENQEPEKSQRNQDDQDDPLEETMSENSLLAKGNAALRQWLLQRPDDCSVHRDIIERQQREIEQVRASEKRVSAGVEALRDAYMTQNTRADAAEETVAQQAQTIARKGKDFDRLQSFAQRAQQYWDEQIAVRIEQVAQHQERITQQEQQIAQQAEEVAAQNEQLAQHQERITQQEQQLAEQAEQLRTQTATIANLTQRFRRREARTRNRQPQTQEDRADPRDQRIRDHEESIRLLKDDVRMFMDHDHARNTQLGMLLEINELQKSRIAALEGQPGLRTAKEGETASKTQSAYTTLLTASSGDLESTAPKVLESSPSRQERRADFGAESTVHVSQGRRKGLVGRLDSFTQ
ncbi:hypothetical protein HDK77DRAFT_252878 [Phyllosticta capitalensis]